MSTKLEKKRDDILVLLLPYVSKYGWTWQAIEAAKVKHDLIASLFPEKLNGLAAYFSHYCDRMMLQRLHNISDQTKEQRIRDKISTAIIERLKILSPHKDIVKESATYYSYPIRKVSGAKNLWKTADVIWKWTDDTSTDYNYYTKRILLSGVISSTLLFWLGSEDPELQKTKEFLDRRINNVMQINRFLKKAS